MLTEVSAAESLHVLPCLTVVCSLWNWCQVPHCDGKMIQYPIRIQDLQVALTQAHCK